MSKVVAIAGYFDPIHEGHLDHIDAARRLGRRLVAIVATEEQCCKKHGRRFHSWEGKVRLLRRLGVDRVVANVDTDGSCAETLRLVHPDIFAKGGEYHAGSIPRAEVEVCQELGIQLIFGVGERLNRSSAYWERRSVVGGCL